MDDMKSPKNSSVLKSKGDSNKIKLNYQKYYNYKKHKN